MATIHTVGESVPHQPLHTLVFNGGDEHMGFGVNSTVVYGEREAAVIDAQFTLANAHRLAAEILELDRELKYIYITHMHPDHFLGLSVLRDAFPNAQVVSLPPVAAMVNQAYDFKIQYWGTEVLGRNGTKSAVEVVGLNEAVMLLEGQKLEILGPLRGDSELQTAIWIPSIKTLVAADTVFADAHVWVADDKTTQMRQEWLDVLDALEALEPLVVVPGHAPSASYVSPDAIKFTREYILAFVEELKTAKSSDEIIDAMQHRYPGLCTHICLEFSAKILKDKFRWPGEWPPALREVQPEY